jgi:hypothetical protein
MRVKKTFSGCRVTVARDPVPPSNFVREKLASTRMSRFKYQFNPTAHAFAADADEEGSAKIGNAALSTFNSA